MHLVQEFKPFDNLVVQFNKLIVTQGINVDFHVSHLSRILLSAQARDQADYSAIMFIVCSKVYLLATCTWFADGNTFDFQSVKGRQSLVLAQSTLRFAMLVGNHLADSPHNVSIRTVIASRIVRQYDVNKAIAIDIQHNNGSCTLANLIDTFALYLFELANF